MEWISWVVQFITGIVIGIIGYFIKRDRDTASRSEQKMTDRIEKVETEIKNLPFVYTTREDFIRATSQIDMKLDKILDRISKEG